MSTEASRRWHLITNRSIAAMVECLEAGRVELVKNDLREMLERIGLSDEDIDNLKRIAAVYELEQMR